MAEENRQSIVPGKRNLEEDNTTDVQKKIEEKVAADEQRLEGDQLSAELSKDRTHMSEHRTKMSEHRTELSDTRTILSYQRTALSYERTLMSWIRTATSLISFGFTIYKFFQEVQKENTQPKVFTPRVVGMIMILFGFIGLLFAQLQHEVAYKRLKGDYPQIQRSLSSVLSLLILAFGLILFLAVLFRQ
jgi:putative membrane protein